MLLFLDTEFTSLEEEADLISIGLVKEDGDFFYGELPKSDWEFGASIWVRENVVPLLWCGSWTKHRPDLASSLFSFIENINDKVMVITDSPEFDWELMKPLLNPWPRNLAISCMRFDSLSMGRNRQPWLLDIKEQFHKEHGMAHHALRDAQSLREMMKRALEAGWCPTK